MGNIHTGNVVDVSEKLANAWIKAGIARKADANETKPAKATTPSGSPKAQTEPADTTGEVVDDQADENENIDGLEQTNLVSELENNNSNIEKGKK